MAKERGKRDKTQPLGKRRAKKPGRTRKKTSPLMTAAGSETLSLEDAENSEIAGVVKKKGKKKAAGDKAKKASKSSAPPPKPSDPGDTEDARKERRQRRLDAQLVAALYTTTDEEMTRFRRLRLGRDSVAPLDALMRGRELLEVLVQALRAGDDADAWDDLDLALRTARGQGAAESMASLPRRLKEEQQQHPPLVSSRQTPAQAQMSSQQIQDSWAHHQQQQMAQQQASHAQPLPSSAQHMAHHSSAQSSAQQQQAAAQHAAAQQAAAQQAAAQQAAAQQAAAQQAAAQQAAAQQQAQQQAAAQHHAHGQHPQQQHPPMSAAQHTQRSGWAPGQWPQGYGPGQAQPALPPGQAYAPGSLPVQGAYAATPPGYNTQGQHQGAVQVHGHAGAAGHGVPAQQHGTGQVPAYPVQQVGTYGDFADTATSFAETATHLPHDVHPTPMAVESREPTPPLFKPIGDTTQTPPASSAGGTIPPMTGTEPPPPAPTPTPTEEPAPQSTTSPNTPLPDPSPSPPPADVTPPANRDGDALADDLDADATQAVKPLRPFVEDGKTTQLSFTSNAHPFALSLEHYAALCAERDHCNDTDRERKIHKRYDIGDKRARSLVDRLFKLRFEADPDVEAEWRRYYDRFKARLDEAPTTDENP